MKIHNTPWGKIELDLWIDNELRFEVYDAYGANITLLLNPRQALRLSEALRQFVKEAGK